MPQAPSAWSDRAPFDAVADRYDEVFTDSSIGRAQRSLVWKVLAKAYASGDHVIDIGCGTGVDACFLASLGVEVTACDASPRMVEIAAQRAKLEGKQVLVHPRQLTAEAITSLDCTRAFDGAYSNFGVINCVVDHRLLAAGLATLLRPRAPVVLCWMGRFCMWETALHLFKADPSKAFRRLRRNGLTANLAADVAIKVTYPSIRRLVRAFTPYFTVRGIRGIGIFVPPSYCEVRARQFPRLLRAATGYDAVAGRCPAIRLLADHVLLCLERRPA